MADKIQDTSTTNQDENTTEITWSLEEARKLAQELLKDFPSGNKKGSCIMPAPKRSQAEKRLDIPESLKTNDKV